MAYLSDDDEKNQKDSQSSQDGFNILAPASSATTGQGKSTNDANDNAQNYSQDYDGGNSSGSTKQSSQSTANTGLTSGTAGGGYINFQSYANANPSTSGQISSAGQNLVSNERKTTNLGSDPKTGFSSALPTYNANSSDVPLDGTVSGFLTNSTPVAPTEDDVKNALNSGDTSTLKGWAGETYTAPDIGYTPSADWQKDSPTLSQTPTLGGANSPSVIDFLARKDIQNGTYGLGERSLDQALISGDPAAQQAIQGNQKLFGDWTNEVNSRLHGMQGDESAYGKLAPLVSQNTNQYLNDIGNSINQKVSDVVSGANTSSDSERNKALTGYKDFLGSDAYKNGGQWTSTETPGSATAAGVISKDDAITLNRIADVLGNPEPYPDPSKVGGGITSESIQTSSTGGFNPNSNVLAEVGPHDIPKVQAYVDASDPAGLSGAGGKFITNPSAVNTRLTTPSEIAAYVAMHPDQATNYPQLTAKDLQTAGSDLAGLLAAEPANWPYRSQISSELNAVVGKLQGMNPTLYDYGISLGYKPEDLEKMGITAPTPPTLKRPTI